MATCVILYSMQLKPLCFDKLIHLGKALNLNIYVLNIVESFDKL